MMFCAGDVAWQRWKGEPLGAWFRPRLVCFSFLFFFPDASSSSSSSNRYHRALASDGTDAALDVFACTLCGPKHREGELGDGDPWRSRVCPLACLVAVELLFDVLFYFILPLHLFQQPGDPVMSVLEPNRGGGFDRWAESDSFDAGDARIDWALARPATPAKRRLYGRNV
ncbi:hypothetical protein LX36DRAFT_388099 [Colletotrichum falcatum]|nr:hypothetical protein LX36DRAFT_388099 [Colletotrichum falcatum]